VADRAEVTLTQTGCHGWCEQGPIVTIEPSGTFYAQVKPANAEAIVAALATGKPVASLLYFDTATKARIETYHEIPFYARQTR